MCSKGGGKDGRPHRRAACEPGQGLTAAAISGVVRALGNRPSFPPFDYLESRIELHSTSPKIPFKNI